MLAIAPSWIIARLSPFASSPPAARFEEPENTVGLSELKSTTTNLSWMCMPAPPLNSWVNGHGTFLTSAEKPTTSPIAPSGFCTASPLSVSTVPYENTVGSAAMARSESRTEPDPVGAMTANSTELLAARMRLAMGPSEIFQSLWGDSDNENFGRSGVLVAEPSMYFAEIALPAKDATATLPAKATSNAVANMPAVAGSSTTITLLA